MPAADARYLNPPGLMDARRFFSQVVVTPRGTTVYVVGQTGFRVDRSIASIGCPQARSCRCLGWHATGSCSRSR